MRSHTQSLCDWPSLNRKMHHWMHFLYLHFRLIASPLAYKVLVTLIVDCIREKKFGCTQHSYRMVRHLSGLKSADFACPIRIVFSLKSPEGSMRAWPRTTMLLVWHKRDYWIIESQRQYHTTDPQTRFVRQVLAQLIQLFSLPFDLQSPADTYIHTHHTHTHTHKHTQEQHTTLLIDM
jgi:hypothetical protein